MNPTDPRTAPVRFVALGDSQTEGLNDGDDDTGYRGWADRLADHIARVNPDVSYANLAVRGMLVHQVLSQQLPAAEKLMPSLAAVSAGMNDLLRPSFDPTVVAANLDIIFAAFRATGCTVITMTYPALPQRIPGQRFIRRRIDRLNVEIRRVAAMRGVHVIDLAVEPVAADPRFWSWDRLHLNAAGHQRIADAAASIMGLEGAEEGWTQPLTADDVYLGAIARSRSDLRWCTRFLIPWLFRRLRRQSSGAGREPKRPTMQHI